MSFTQNAMSGYNWKIKYSLCLWMPLLIYISGIAILSWARGLPWNSLPAFWVGISGSSLWIKLVSLVTILSGTILIYFIPGVFYFIHRDTDWVVIFAKGFLTNYIYYYLSTTLYKALLGQEVTRGVMLIFAGLAILITSLIFLFSRRSQIIKPARPGSLPSGDLIFMLICLIALLIIFRDKIFFALFGGDGDGVEQFWLAYSLKSRLLPTFFREPVTMVPQFPFAPSIYLNMFALVLFGSAEFIIKIQILVAFISIFFILKELIRGMSKNNKLNFFNYLPLIIYLVIFFIIIAYRAAYSAPTEMAKSNETLQLAFFLLAFYLLVKQRARLDILAAIFFVLAGMIRYNGLIMITVFLVLFSILFNRYKCCFMYLIGLILSAAILRLALINSPLYFSDMLRALSAEIGRIYPRPLDFNFTLNYLKNYFIFTSGLSVFFLLGHKNKYIVLMTLTSLAYLMLPLRASCVPAHFFVPIFMFPLLSYYLWLQNIK